MSAILLTNSGSGNVTIPAHSGKVVVECWGAGDIGNDPIDNPGGTGHGGAYARSSLTLAAGDYSYYIAGANDPSDTVFDDRLVLAESGYNGGDASGSVGDVKFSGGASGANASDTGGGGGSSASPSSDGAAGQDGANGGGPGGDLGSGAGVEFGRGGSGADENQNGHDGESPGGGGGNAINGEAGSGARGQIRITYTAPTTVRFQRLSIGIGIGL